MTARVVLTRPAARQVALQASLEHSGLEVLGLPALNVVALESLGKPPQPNEFDAAVFVSRSAWQHYWQALRAQDPSFVWPDNCRLAGVGAGTAQAISHDLDCAKADQAAVLMPAPDATQDSESLWLRLRKALPPAGKVLLVRGEDGRDWLSQTLQAHGFTTRIHAVYRREPAQWSKTALTQLKQWQAAGSLGTWLITSVQGLEAIQSQWTTHGLGSGRPQGAVVIHPRLQAPVSAWLGPYAPVAVTQPDDQSIASALGKLR